MKLSRTIAYGVHAAIHLAQTSHGQPLPSSQLAREASLPERFLVQILRCLVNHGVLKSACGASGGYTLSRHPSQITLRDIVESFDSPLEVRLSDLARMTQNVRTLAISTLDDASAAGRARLQKSPSKTCSTRAQKRLCVYRPQ